MPEDIYVLGDRCTGCEACVAVCPTGAILMQDGVAHIGEECTLCRACLSTCPVEAIVLAREEVTGPVEAGQGVWVFVEHRQGQVHSVVYELLGQARALADQLGSKVSTVLAGAPGVATTAHAGRLIEGGADAVIV
ncbi:MAG TPA: 4Fe-4S dicluster domain-containing protein, partial [Firmicutes bacterium]|nr:4Fe-4S dicluster domain-containing protein [Bacillota bacterium]